MATDCSDPRDLPLTSADLEEAITWAIAQGWRPSCLAGAPVSAERPTMPPPGAPAPEPTGASPQP